MAKTKFKKSKLSQNQANRNQSAKDQLSDLDIKLLLKEAHELLLQHSLVKAVAICKYILEHRPDDERALDLCATVMNEGGQYDSAAKLLEKAISIKPDNAMYYYKLAHIKFSQKNQSAALPLVLKAIDLDDSNPYFHYLFGTILQTVNQLESSLHAFDKAIELEPNMNIAYQAKYFSFKEMGKEDEAEAFLREFVEKCPNAVEQVALRLAQSRICKSEEDIALRRQKLSETIDDMMSADINTVENPNLLMNAPPFYLAYHGVNDSELMTKFSQLFRKLCPTLNFVAPHCDNDKASEKIKLGFISSYFQPKHPVGISYRNIISSIAKQEAFEVTVFYTKSAEGIGADEFFGDKNINYVAVPQNFQLAQQSLASEEVDILVFTDIGMNILTYFLAFGRYAKQQCVMGGHPNTSGINTVDYFISMRYMDAEKPQSHYTETALLLDSPAIIFNKPDVPENWKSREELEMPIGKRIYACPMMLHKLHPSFDEIIKGILDRDPEGVVILFQDLQFKEASEQFTQRLKPKIDDFEDRVIFSKFYPQQSFLHFIYNCDVLLDSTHFGGGTTTYIALAVGTPIITLPGEFLRGRITYGTYKWLGLDDTIAESTPDYIEKAVAIANDQKLRQSIIDKTLAVSDKLYGDKTGILEEMTQLFLDMSDDNLDKYIAP